MGWELWVGRCEGWALEANLRVLGGRRWEQAIPPPSLLGACVGHELSCRPSPPMLRVPAGQDEICPQPTLQSCSCLAPLSIFSVGLIISLSSCWGSPPPTGAPAFLQPSSPRHSYLSPPDVSCGRQRVGQAGCAPGLVSVVGVGESSF